ncbi:MAG: hypothetical protein R3B46_10100 [Phycisphaerales bacterium]
MPARCRIGRRTKNPQPAKADSSDISLARAGASHTFTADLDDGGGGDVRYRAADFIIDWAPAEKVPIVGRARNEASWYDW